MRLRTPVLAAACAAFSLSFSAFAQEAPLLKEPALRAHLSFLADDLLEGRGTGQRGGDLAVRYLETQAAAIGLQPMPGGSYRQPVPVQGTRLVSGSVGFDAGGKRIAPKPGEGIVFGTASGKADVAFDAPLVFVGYGVSAPEEKWDDYKGLDVKGKILVMMVDDPQPTADEPNRFAGRPTPGTDAGSINSRKRHAAAPRARC